MRLAAGRARAVGMATRGTTGPQRLRRVDRWLVQTRPEVLRRAAAPLVVDLGFGASPVTTLELAARLRAVRPDVQVVGVEIDRERVAAARAACSDPAVRFVHAGFELAGLGRPALVRAMNVLRQYGPDRVAGAWEQLCGALAPGGLLVEGTCDEIGRRASWVALTPDGRPASLTLSVHLASLRQPSQVAERLPKVLIERNRPGEPVHSFLAALDRAWAAEAARAVFGPRQRFAAAVARLPADGWPVRRAPARWRLGEVEVAWGAVAPASWDR